MCNWCNKLAMVWLTMPGDKFICTDCMQLPENKDAVAEAHVEFEIEYALNQVAWANE